MPPHASSAMRFFYKSIFVHSNLNYKYLFSQQGSRLCKFSTKFNWPFFHKFFQDQRRLVCGRILHCGWRWFTYLDYGFKNKLAIFFCFVCKLYSSLREGEKHDRGDDGVCQTQSRPPEPDRMSCHSKYISTVEGVSLRNPLQFHLYLWDMFISVLSACHATPHVDVRQGKDASK